MTNGSDNSSRKIELLKDIYNHIIYQYDFVDRANEGLSDKAMRMAGFCGVIIGLLVNIVINKASPLGIFEKIVVILSVVLIFASIFCYIKAALVRQSKGLIKPKFLLDKFKENTPSEKFWEQFAKVAEKAYEHAKKNNLTKSLWVRMGDKTFACGIFLLALLSIVYFTQ